MLWILDEVESVSNAYVGGLVYVVSAALAEAPALVVRGVSRFEGQDEKPAFGDDAAQAPACFLLCPMGEIAR